MMKALTLVVGILTGSTVHSFAQGEVIFANNTATKITNVLTGDAWWGSDSTLLRVALYGAHGDSQPESSLVLQASAVTNLLSPGRFMGGLRVLDLPADRATLQVRAWGASSFYPTYEAAVVGGLGGDSSVVIGLSSPFSLRLTIPLNPPTPIIDFLQSFVVQPIPEPSTWALGVLGAVVLLPLLRRRRS